jgi:glutaminyl-tRNA synthetase
MYDYAHGQSDSIEKITHSICTLEFDVHRPLYDWFIEKLGIFPSHQYEFARLNLTYTIMSKRNLLELVKRGYVSGWDDPRMPTICGMRRRGYTPESIRLFADKIGVAKHDNVIELSLLEWCVRDDLNRRAMRRMAVLDPIKVVITNYPEGQTEDVDAVNNPEDESAGKRKVPFSRELYIERDDFMENPPKKYFRLSPGGEVRLRYAYIIKCEEVIKNTDGDIVELRCTYDPETRSGSGNTRQVKGTIHWVSIPHAQQAEVRLFDRLFTEARMDAIPEDKNYKDFLNPDSLRTVAAFVEPALKGLPPFTHVQFERLGYFTVDPDSTPDNPTFNRTVTLKDTWAKMLLNG